MAKLYDVMYPNGKYNDENGQEKTRWIKCGMIVGTAAGKVALKLDVMPMCPPPNQSGEGGLWLQCFEPNQPDGQRRTANAPQGGGGFRPAAPVTQGAPVASQPQGGGVPQGGGFDDDIPF